MDSKSLPDLTIRELLLREDVLVVVRVQGDERRGHVRFEFIVPAQKPEVSRG